MAEVAKKAEEPDRGPDTSFQIERQSAAFISRMAMYVFVGVSAVVILSTLALTYYAFQDEDRYHEQIAMVAQFLKILLSLAALCIFTAFLSGSVQGWLAPFTFVVVAAFIIPTSEIMKIVILLTGSDRSIEDASPASFQRVRTFSQPTGKDAETKGAETSPFGASQDVSEFAYRISGELQHALRLRGEPLSETQVAELRLLVDKTMGQHIVREISVQVASIGAAPTLLAITANRFGSYVLRHASEGKLDDDARFLRSEGLVRFPYDAFAEAEPTPLGCQVMNHIDRERIALEAASGEAPTAVHPVCEQVRAARRFDLTAPSLDGPIFGRRITPPSGTGTLDRLTFTGEAIDRDVVFGAEVLWFSLMNEGDDARIEIVAAGADEMSDPVLYFAEADSGVILDEVDDILDEDGNRLSSDARMIATAERGVEYLVGLGGFDGSAGSARLTIRSPAVEGGADSARGDVAPPAAASGD